MRRKISFFLLLFVIGLIIGAVGCRDPFVPGEVSPYVIITKPPTSGGTDIYATVIAFQWESAPYNPDSVRYFWGLVTDTVGIYNPSFDIIRDLNENPWRYENRWNRWISYAAPGDSGKSTILGDDEIMEINKVHIFAVQAKDYAGDYTKVFELGLNTRRFIVSAVAGPLLSVTEPFIGFREFVGDALTPVSVEIPPGIPLNFSWVADASSYGGEIVCYRYGWDIQDLNDPSQWDTACSPFITAASEKTLYSGIHTFFVEAKDNANKSTIGVVEVTILPFSMDRNLLWVDDFYSVDFTQIMYHIPTETEHDTFWLDICSRADGFNPGVDVYDATPMNFRPPDLSKIGQYKNIIWTFNADDGTGAWDNVVRFTPESFVGVGSSYDINYLPLFLVKGGHLWTLGRSDGEGGLAAVLSSLAQQFPMNLRCEITGNQTGCYGDTSGVYSMPYKDYCVTVLDKVAGNLRTDPGMPTRNIDYDAMSYAYKDEIFGYNDTYPGLPDQLQLWSEVVAPGRFFDPAVRGFSYVEIYDPEYWMDITITQNQECFAPMYRMRARNSLSAVDYTTVSLWITKYETIVPDVMSGVAVPARSVHFGFPLWFFNRAAVDSIVEVVFDEWQINAP